MRSFQQIIVVLFALLVCAFAQSESFDATVYITSTVTRVDTVTLSGSATATHANSTSTLAKQTGNSTAALKTGSSTAPPIAETTKNAASSLSANSALVALAAGVAYLVL